MASIIQTNGKYRYSDYDNPTLGNGEVLIASGLSKADAYKYVNGANNKDSGAITAIANLQRATQEKQKAAAAEAEKKKAEEKANNTKHWYGWVVKDEYNPKGKAEIGERKLKDKPEGAEEFPDKAAAKAWKEKRQAELDASGPESDYEHAKKVAQTEVNDNAKEQEALDKAIQAQQEEQTKVKKTIKDVLGGKAFDKNNQAQIQALKDWYDSDAGTFDGLKTFLQSYNGNGSMTSKEMYDFLKNNGFHGTKVDAWVNEHTNKDGTFLDKENSVEKLNEDNKTAQENVQSGTAKVQGERAGVGTLGTGGTPEEQLNDLLEGTNGATKTEHPDEVKEGFDATYNADYDNAQKEMDAQKDDADGKNIENQTVEVGNTQVDPVHNQFSSGGSDGASDTKPEQKTPPTPPEDGEAKDFWKKWRAGALRAYPMLQSIGDAISRNARMTADRAAILTGGQRDTSAYDPIQIQETTPEQRVQLAFADAEAGNYDTLKQAIMAGTIDIDNAAQALNTTPESLKERFNRSERSDEADVTGKEMSNVEIAQGLDQSNEAMITAINNQINANNEAIRALRNPDESWDNYAKAAHAVIDTVSGIKTAGSNYSKVNEKAAKANIKGGVPVVSGEVGGQLSNAITNTTTKSTDLKALEYLQTALDNGQKAYDATDKNNEIAAQKLEAWNAELEKDRKYYEGLREPYRKLQGKTALNYDPGEGTPKKTPEEENTNAETTGTK